MISLLKSSPGKGMLYPELSVPATSLSGVSQPLPDAFEIRRSGIGIAGLLAALLLLILSSGLNAQTIFIGADQYAFQYQPAGSPTPLGLYFNATLTRYEFRDIGGTSVLSIDPVNDFTVIPGKLGIGLSTEPANDFEVSGRSLFSFSGSGAALQVDGESRFGTPTVYTLVNSAGNLRFSGGAVMEVAGDRYAFKAEASNNGLYFNQTGNQYEFRNSLGEPTLTIGANTGAAGDLTVTGESEFQDRVGVATGDPDADLQVIGTTRLGSAANYLGADASGNLEFTGTANYLVGDDRYAFKASGSDAGLLFNTTADEFQLLDPSAVSIFAVQASGPDAGNTTISGSLDVNGTLISASPAGLAQISAHSSLSAQLAAIRGRGFNENTFGYLAVEGDSLHDGTSLDIRNDEIGVLGIALDTASGTTDDYGVLGYSSHVGMRGENVNGYYTELGTPAYALRVEGPASFSEKLSVDSFEILTSLLIEETTEMTLLEDGPFILGFPGGNRLNLDRKSIQARNSSGTSLLELNPLGGNVNIGNGGGNVNLATTGTGVVSIASGGGNVNIGNGGGIVNVATTAAGPVNIATGGGNINMSDILYTDNADERVGIGVIDPQYTLTVKHPTGTLTRNGIALINSLTNTTWHLYSFTDGDLGLFEADSLKGRFDNVSGMYMVTSDRKLKIKIREMGSVLDQVMDLQPRRYRYRSEEGGKRDYYGFVAQEVEQVFPDLVTMDPETGIRAVSYTELVPVALAAIQEQDAEVQKIEEEVGMNAESVQALTARLEEALDRIDDLEQSLSACCTVQTQTHGEAQDEPASADLAQLLEVHPNPVADQATVNYFLPEAAGNAQLRMTDSNGRLAAEYELQSSGFGSVRIQHPGTSGQYLVSLFIDGKLVDALSVIMTR